MAFIKISEDFTDSPGARYRTDGENSGEQFREEFLEPLFRDAANTEEIVIDLDDTEGYATSFLEEAFGGLARVLKSSERVLNRLKFISSQEETLPDEITKYIKDYNG